MHDGYIKFYRKMLENPVVCKDSDHLAIWAYLLLNATHKERKMLFGSKTITLFPGQLITGRKKIATDLKLNESKVERVLKTFKIEQQIEQQTSSKNRLISIFHWDKYQSSEQQIEQQVNNNRTTSEQQVNTNKNVKKDKNERMKEIYTPKTASDYQKIIDSFNSICVNFPKVKLITDKRKQTLRNAKLGDLTFEDFFGKVQDSDFLTGRDGKWLGCCFDWIFKPTNLTKIIEGNYDNRKPKEKETTFDISEYERIGLNPRLKKRPNPPKETTE